MEPNEQKPGVDFSHAEPEVVEALLHDSPDPGIFLEIANANLNRPEILWLLLEHHEIPEDARSVVSQALSLPVAPPPPKPIVNEPVETKRETLTTKIQKLGVSQRVQLAMRGGREIRSILIRDTNKEVSLSVLENGKITESEIEMMAKNRGTLEEILRRIAKNREWMKNYSIVSGIVTNPKTPPGIALSFVSDIKTKDLVMLEKNKNVSEAVRSAAKRLLSVRKKG